jgi:hypothetical protein
MHHTDSIPLTAAEGGIHFLLLHLLHIPYLSHSLQSEHALIHHRPLRFQACIQLWIFGKAVYGRYKRSLAYEEAPGVQEEWSRQRRDWAAPVLMGIDVTLDKVRLAHDTASLQSVRH